MKSRVILLVASLGAMLSFSACGGVSMGGNIQTPTTYTISGSISGLTASGLQLQNNGVNTQTIASGATSFSFSGVASGSAYSITVSAQPTGETCTVASGTGTASGNVSSVEIACTTVTVPTYTISGTVSGLTAAGLVLQDNLGDNLTVASGATSFTFATAIPAGGAYAVTVFTQPTGETCTVSNGVGTANADVTNVAIACTTVITPTYTISGTITGLTASGMQLENNGASAQTIASGATTFSFTGVPSGSAYAITVSTQPTGLTCSVANGGGTISGNVTNVAIACSATTFTISGTITGLTASGMQLENNGGGAQTIASGATTFSFTGVPSGSAYAISVSTQPTGLTCTVANGSGTISGNVTNVAITCSATTFTISGTITGLTASGMQLENNGGSAQTIASGATTFSFTGVPGGSAYAITVSAQPTGLTCTVTNGTGTANANVTNVAVACTATTTFTISGTITGLTASGMQLENNGGSAQTIASGATTFSFTGITGGSAYAITVSTQPTGETCTVANGTGTANANVTNVAITCTVTISGTISGLTASGMQLENNGGSAQTIASGATTFSFTGITGGSAYAITVSTQPTGLTCTVANGTGTANANVTNVAITCAAAVTYTISGTISGLTASGMQLENNGAGAQTIASGATTFSFTNIPAGSAYSITVSAQPTGLTCTVANGSGTANGNVTNVAITCAPSAVGGTWTWKNGAKTVGQGGNYGTPPTKRVFNATNVPGARLGATTWTDASGNLWLFGGLGDDINDNGGYLDDLWEWNGTQWAWISGNNAGNPTGIYGTGGTSVPGGRYGAAGWKDAAGNFWLFGGYGLDSLGVSVGPLNDLWEFTTAGSWNYINGSELVNPKGTYGTQGSPGSGNFPGGRYQPSFGMDASGNFWLFGGQGFDSAGNQGSLNDLWEFNFSLQEWEWVSGSNIQGQSPTYGTQGTPASKNVPGARYTSVSWMDSSGDFWLYGGVGIDSTATYGSLNDVWEYFPSSGEWAWQGPTGSNVADQPGNYVAIGEAGTPGGRQAPSGWLDSNGNFWLFGGVESDGDVLNDLWELSAGTWTWESGSSTANQLGTYPGSVGGTGTPGGRNQAASWIDKNNNLWLFGGYGAASTFPVGELNDLWEFVP
jgi:environmental stress-induced protein Ves